MRRVLDNWLEQMELDLDVRQDSLLAVSEAAANAAEHAYGFDGKGLVSVEAWIAGEELHVAVRDRGTWRTPRASEGRGRGRMIMNGLMRTVTIDQDNGGTVVRMSMPTLGGVSV
jgi:anti-sigma regulatory factor (Ser/Thr protein kinase)